MSLRLTAVGASIPETTSTSNEVCYTTKTNRESVHVQREHPCGFRLLSRNTAFAATTAATSRPLQGLGLGVSNSSRHEWSNSASRRKVAAISLQDNQVRLFRDQRRSCTENLAAAASAAPELLLLLLRRYPCTYTFARQLPGGGVCVWHFS